MGKTYCMLGPLGRKKKINGQKTDRDFSSTKDFPTNRSVIQNRLSQKAVSVSVSGRQPHSRGTLEGI